MVAAPVKYAASVGRASAVHKTETEGVGSTAWTGEAGRHVGTVVHCWLERFALEGLNLWSRERLAEMELPLRRQLLAHGVAGTKLTESCERILQTLQTVLDSRKARWLLFSHPEAASEYPLSGMIDGELVHAVVDRTFVDDDGNRWVIDFKTGSPLPNEEPASFYQRETERYRDQLVRYASLFRRLEPARLIRCALYFPSFDGWCEITLEGRENEGKIKTGSVSR